MKKLTICIVLLVLAAFVVAAGESGLWKLRNGVMSPAKDSWSVAIGMSLTSDADGIILTSADWGKLIWMTGAGEVQLPDAGASDIGKYITVVVRDASEQVEVVLTDGTELIVLTDGTATTAGDEADMALTASSKTTFVYAETGKWYSFGSTVTDGGVAD